MNSNNYNDGLGENLSDKITNVRVGEVKALGVVYKGTLPPFQTPFRFILNRPIFNWGHLFGFCPF